LRLIWFFVNWYTALNIIKYINIKILIIKKLLYKDTRYEIIKFYEDQSFFDSNCKIYKNICMISMYNNIDANA